MEDFKPSIDEQVNFDSSNFFIFFIKWRKILIITTLVAAIIAAIISLLIKEKYEAKVTLFPTRSNAISKALITDQGGREGILQFGEEEQAQQMIQILKSNEIRDTIIKKFDLANHWKIDPKYKYARTALYKEYESNIKFRRTEYLSVEIKVRDEDPILAANIANTIAELYDSTKLKIQRQRALEGFKIVEGTYLEIQQQINQKEDSLKWLNQKGIGDYNLQVERLTEAIGREIGRGNAHAVNILQAQLDTITKYGALYKQINEQLALLNRRLIEFQQKYDEAKIDAFSKIPQKFVVEYAYPPDRKAYPVRWLIVVVSALAAFVLTLVCLIFYENYEKYKKKLKYSAR
ncbi:MAG: Wzz/FepE/Etk N-terminal domain-containing protein [Bacteroidales bacterium]